MRAEITVEQILDSAGAMHDFIEILHYAGLVNCGDPQPYGPMSDYKTFGYYQDCILLWASYKSDASISIASKKRAITITGSKLSFTPHESNFTTVWNGNGWIKRGPWEKHIIAFLEKLIVTTASIVTAKDREMFEKALIEKEEEGRKEQLLLKEWA